ncbi:MAG: hypothetical protein AB2L24_23845 [Mangrovibacterium sp.]
MEERASPEQQQLIEEDLDQFRQLYRDYHSRLYQLRHLAEEYETMRQNIRLKLRQQHQATRQNGQVHRAFPAAG